MSVSYVRPTWGDFESWADEHYTWEEAETNWGERVIDIPLPLDYLTVRIFTTVNKSNDEGRDNGSDAIRTVIWNHDKERPVGGREYTKRIQTDEDRTRFLKNMDKKVRWLAQNWRIFRNEMTCPECSGDLRLGESEYGEYHWCENDHCEFTESLPVEQCDECGGGMVEKSGKYGDFLACKDCDHTADA